MWGTKIQPLPNFEEKMIELAKHFVQFLLKGH